MRTHRTHCRSTSYYISFYAVFRRVHVSTQCTHAYIVYVCVQRSSHVKDCSNHLAEHLCTLCTCYCKCGFKSTYNRSS